MLTTTHSTRGVLTGVIDGSGGYIKKLQGRKDKRGSVEGGGVSSSVVVERIAQFRASRPEGGGTSIRLRGGAGEEKGSGDVWSGRGSLALNGG